MKPCIRCTAPLEDAATLCPNCGTNQNPALFSKDYKYKRMRQKEDDTFLIVLCALTIAGALFGSVSFFVGSKLFDDMYGNNVAIVVAISVLVNVGKLTGAVLMLLKKRLGLYIYTATALLAIVYTVLAKYLIVNQVATNVPQMPGLQIISTIFAVVFQVVFVVLYWLKVNRRLLA